MSTSIMASMMAPRSGIVIEYPDFCVGRSLGKNGEANNVALRVTVSEAVLRVQPVAKRALALQQAWIDIPNHPSVLRQLQAVIAQALHETGAPTAADVIDLVDGGVE